MAKLNFYVLEETVRSYDVGPDQTIKVRPLLQYLQEAASGHARQAGDTFDEQVRRGAVWVLSRLHLSMQRLPRWGETIRIETWSAGIGTFQAIRDFRIEDAGGQCGAATTQWVLIDVAKRRPVQISPDLEDAYGRRPEREIDDPFRPLPELDAPKHHRRILVRRGDLDPANHANNAAVVEWCLEGLPAERLDGLQPVSIEVAFKKELFDGDELLAESQEVAVESGRPVFLHRLGRIGDGLVTAVARTKWGPAGPSEGSST